MYAYIGAGSKKISHVFPFIQSFKIHIVVHTIYLIHQRWWTLTIFIVSMITVLLRVCLYVCTQSTIWSADILKHLEKQSTRKIVQSCLRLGARNVQRFSIFLWYLIYIHTSFSPRSVFVSFYFSSTHATGTHRSAQQFSIYKTRFLLSNPIHFQTTEGLISSGQLQHTQRCMLPFRPLAHTHNVFSLSHACRIQIWPCFSFDIQFGNFSFGKKIDWPYICVDKNRRFRLLIMRLESV